MWLAITRYYVALSLLGGTSIKQCWLQQCSFSRGSPLRYVCFFCTTSHFAHISPFPAPKRNCSKELFPLDSNSLSPSSIDPEFVLMRTRSLAAGFGAFIFFRESCCWRFVRSLFVLHSRFDFFSRNWLFPHSCRLFFKSAPRQTRHCHQSNFLGTFLSNRGFMTRSQLLHMPFLLLFLSQEIWQHVLSASKMVLIECFTYHWEKCVGPSCWLGLKALKGLVHSVILIDRTLASEDDAGYLDNFSHADRANTFLLFPNSKIVKPGDGYRERRRQSSVRMSSSKSKKTARNWKKADQRTGDDGSNFKLLHGLTRG